jgi:hypothetical protein
VRRGGAREQRRQNEACPDGARFHGPNHRSRIGSSGARELGSSGAREYDPL